MLIASSEDEVNACRGYAFGGNLSDSDNIEVRLLCS
jgi:hypothetical protein